MLLTTAPEQARPLHEIKITLSAIPTEEQAQTLLAAKTAALQDLTHQAQEATVILQLPDPITQAQVVPAMAAAVAAEDHLAEAEEDNHHLYFE
jgi:hypothetical protein